MGEANDTPPQRIIDLALRSDKLHIASNDIELLSSWTFALYSIAG
jgi:hypothetical protein